MSEEWEPDAHLEQDYEDRQNGAWEPDPEPEDEWWDAEYNDEADRMALPIPVDVRKATRAKPQLAVVTPFTDPATREDEIKERVERAMTRLSDQLSQGHSENYLEVLKFYALFHRYSVRNSMLIMMQRPDATHVNALTRWNKLGFRLRKGEKAIWIYCPILRREPDEQTGELVERVVGFRLGPVYDWSQLADTEGKTPPTLWKPLPDDVEHLYQRAVVSLKARHNIEVVVRRLPVATQGASIGGKIIVQQGLDSRNRLFVLLHEACHEWEHLTPEGHAKPKKQREWEVESTAFVVASYLGLEHPTAADYLLSYQCKPEELEKMLGTIQRLSRMAIGLFERDTEAQATPLAA